MLANGRGAGLLRHDQKGCRGRKRLRNAALVSVVVMSGKKLSGKPKLPKVLTYCVRLQDSELKRWLSA